MIVFALKDEAVANVDSMFDDEVQEAELEVDEQDKHLVSETVKEYSGFVSVTVN